MRDIIYSITILVILLIGTIVYNINDKDNFDKNINFTATITSIILAVVAIVYTMVEGIKTANSTSKVEKTATLIEETGGKISDFAKNLEGINKIFIDGNILGKISNLEDGLNSIEPQLNKMKEDLSNKIDNFKSEIYKGSEKDNSDKSINKEKMIISFINNASLGDLCNLYLIVYSSKIGKDVKLEPFLGRFSVINEDTLIGYVFALRAFGILKYNVKNVKAIYAKYLPNNINDIEGLIEVKARKIIIENRITFNFDEFKSLLYEQK